jgi:hypothetical protein
MTATTTDRAEINRRNAQKSTRPETAGATKPQFSRNEPTARASEPQFLRNEPTAGASELQISRNEPMTTAASYAGRPVMHPSFRVSDPEAEARLRETGGLAYARCVGS